MNIQNTRLVGLTILIFALGCLLSSILTTPISYSALALQITTTPTPDDSFVYLPALLKAQSTATPTAIPTSTSIATVTPTATSTPTSGSGGAIQSGHWYGTITGADYNGCVDFEVVESSTVTTATLAGSGPFGTFSCTITSEFAIENNHFDTGSASSCIVAGTFIDNTTASGTWDSGLVTNGVPVAGNWSASPSESECGGLSR